MDLCEFEATLVCRANFRIARAIQRNPVSKNKNYRDKVWSCDERMDHLETAISGDPSYNQLPNADTIAYTSKILLKGPIYGCLL